MRIQHIQRARENAVLMITLCVLSEHQALWNVDIMTGLPGQDKLEGRTNFMTYDLLAQLATCNGKKKKNPINAGAAKCELSVHLTKKGHLFRNWSAIRSCIISPLKCGSSSGIGRLCRLRRGSGSSLGGRGRLDVQYNYILQHIGGGV